MTRLIERLEAEPMHAPAPQERKKRAVK